MKPNRLLIVALFFLLVPASLIAQSADEPNGLLSVDSIFTYKTKSLGPVQWQEDGSGYLALETAKDHPAALDIVRYDALTGKRSIKVAASQLIPRGATAPLVVEEFVLSPDERKMLIFTNSEKVWRSNTRGDYWILDLEGSALWKLGVTAKPSTLMFAKFSPDSS